MTRPSTVVAVLALVLVHAVLLAGGTVASAVSLAAFVLTHPGFGLTASVLVPSAFGLLFTLVLTAGDVVLGVRLWTAARRARIVLTGWLAVVGLITLGGVVTSFVRVAAPSVPFTSLWVVEVALCVAAVVLLWRPATTAWLLAPSVRPAGPRE